MLKGKLKPIGMSVAAAALTAVAFAAVSVAKDDGSKEDDPGERRGDILREGPPGPPGVAFFHERLSDEDRAAMEEFRQCMEDNGAPAPPRPPTREELESGELPKPPEPPSEADREAIEKALEACEDKLPEGLPGPRFGHGPCGPPPGAEGTGEGAVIPAPGPPPSAQS